ncbi:MAG: invasion associated locus B family protein [Rhizomicrobium sp.]
MKIGPVLTGAIAGLVLGCAAAFAQEAPAAPGRPDVKTVGDWMVRCFPVENPNPCDMFQERVDQQSRQRVLTFSLAFVPSMNRHILQITVPLDIAIQKGVTIQAGGYTSPVMKYRMCNREGCFVQLAPDNAVIESLARATVPNAGINIIANSGKSFSLPLSLKGFAGAHDDMVSQARAKAKPVKAGDDAAKP